MVSKKGKRKFEYNGKTFYRFVRADADGIPRLHILSDDRKINLEYPLSDREISNVSSYVKELLTDYFSKTKT